MKRALLLMFVLFISCSVAAGEDPWPGLRGSTEGTAACEWEPASDDVELREWHFAGKSGRRFKVGLAVWASPAAVVIDGRPTVFIGGYDNTMHALDLITKEERWFKVTNGPIQNAPVVGTFRGRLAVFFGSSDRTVYACDARTGKIIWTRELVEPTNTLGDSFVSAPFLMSGRLYIAIFAYDKSLPRNNQKGWLYSLDSATGEARWRVEVSQGFVTSPTGRRFGEREYIYIAARKGLLQAFDVSGDMPVPAWQYQMAHEVFGSPVVDADADSPRLFLGSKFNKLVAIDALTGDELWTRMVGSWIDNTACIGKVGGESVVFVGSHDYCLYAFRAADGEMLWRRRLGGEVYTAPCFFRFEGRPTVAVCALDDHLYIINASTGSVLTSYFTGRPVWDKVAKGDTLWGSPIAIEAGSKTAIVHGSFSGMVYTIPLGGECSLQAKVRSAASLWIGLAVTAFLFCCGVLPVVLLIGRRMPTRA